MKVLAITSVLIVACSGCSEVEAAGSAGERVILRTQVQSDSSSQRPFTTGTRWTVELRSASLAIGSLYYFDGRPAFVRYEVPRRSPAIERFQRFFIGVAHAHPQHYVAGKALGQMTQPAIVNLFDGLTELADGEGVTGEYRSGRLVFPQHDQIAESALDGHIAVASGVATKGDVTVHFLATADLADVARSSPAGEVDGSVFDEARVTQDGIVTLTVRPSVWFNLVDFSEVEPGTEAHPTELAPGTKARIGFALGVAQLSAYRYSMGL